MKKPDLSMKKPDIRVPEVVANVYRDMRDRRLLPVAAALLMAIVAVPVALGSSSNAPAPVKVAANPTPSAGALAAAVKVSDHGVRGLQHRLAGRGPGNPFNQKFQGATSGSTLHAVAGAGSANPTAGAPTTSNKSGGTSKAATPPEQVFVDYRVDVRTGEVGSTLADRNGVKELAFLPGSSKPVFVFSGVLTNGKDAVFLLPGGLALTGGVCLLPVGGNCGVVTMRAGDSIDVVWTDAKIYRLKLDGIHKIKRSAG